MRQAEGRRHRAAVRPAAALVWSAVGMIALVTSTWASPGAMASPSPTPSQTVSQTAASPPAAATGKIAAKFTELTPSDGVGGDEFGEAVAVSGSTMVVGAPYHDSQAGAAYVFTKSATTPPVWTQAAELTQPGGPVASNYFGFSVAIFKGEIVVSSLDFNAGVGAAYVFTGSGSTWTEQGMLTASDGVPGDFFGFSLAVVNKTIVVGAPNINNTTGDAYVFQDRTKGWVQTQELTASDAAPDSDFGYSVALSGTEMLVGAFGAANRNGRGYVFSRALNGTWSQQAELQASDGGGFGGDDFGISVALAGGTAVLGASNHNAGDGAAYVFGQSGTTWSQEAELAGSDINSNSSFGESVGVSGSTILVGTGPNGASPAAVYVFGGSGTSWPQLQEIKAPKTDTGYWGPVALFGKTALVGAQAANGNVGAAYVN